MEGDFTLKSGEKSKYYFDFRKMISHPEIMSNVCNMLGHEVSKLSCEHLCGLPYAGIPLCSVIFPRTGKKMLLLRKERKEHGTKKILEGAENVDECIMIDDVITQGTSALESAEVLLQNGVKPSYLVTIFDREQGGKENLEKKNIKVISLMSLKKFLNIKDAIRSSSKTDICRLDILKQSPSIHTKNLVAIRERKNTNIIASADLKTSKELLDFVREVGDSVCMVKVHSDIVEDFNKKTVDELLKLSKEKDFLIMEDRKFSDIGSTSQMQLFGKSRIIDWADAITVHMISGEAIIKSLSENI